MDNLMEVLKEINDIDYKALERAENWLNSRMKPQGSLGYLEKLSIKIAGITGDEFYKIDNSLHIVASADNGIIEEGVSSCPIEYTRIVSEAMLSGIAAIGILCKNLNVDLKLVDIGIAEEIKKHYPNLYNRNVARGSKNFVHEPALGIENTLKAIFVGIDLIKENKDKYSIFSNGEMGIGNTTTSSAILYSLVKGDINEIVGRGGGLTDQGLENKKRIIKECCEKYDTFNKTPLEIVSLVGGYDIACMIGMYIGAAKYKKPMLIDGFISSVAALVAVRMNPKIKDYIIGTHMSEEPGMKIVFDELGLEAPLQMGMRLGEGTGAVFAHPMARCAMEIMRTMKTKDDVYKIIL